VCWNTKELVERAYNSVRLAHPTMQIIIVDGSSPSMPCYKYLDSIQDAYLKVYHVGKNIGHGRGMHFGIERTNTPFALMFDSDIVMTKSPVQQMLDMMTDGIYGVGWIYKTDITGHEFGSRPEYVNEGVMPYLHPYFCLIQLSEYRKYRPFMHHGAPATHTMLDIYRKGLSKKVLKEFPGLGHTSGKGLVWEGRPSEYIQHDTEPCYVDSHFGGTGAQRVKSNMPHIEGVWDLVIDPMKGVLR
jgi:hypothetical protein